MRNFSSPAAFAAFLPVMMLEVDREARKALEKSAVIVKEEAKRVIGTYEYSWPQLAQSTQEDRVSKGFSANDPLLRTGEMRDSIKHTVDSVFSGQVGHLEAHIGSDNDKALWQELGTVRIPPRSFLGGALRHKSDEIVKMIGQDIVKVIEGNKS